VGDLRLRVSESGGLSFAPSELKLRFAGTPQSEYRVHEGPSGTFLLMRATSEGKPLGRVLMMGELVHRMAVVEIINLVMSSNWRGELHIVGSFGRRILSVDQGALKHAQTEFEHERLGEILVRAGLLPRAQLAPLLAQKRADQRFGQLLVERKLIDQEVLFKQLQVQSETIFYGSLVEERGVYWFVAPPDDAPAPPTTLYLPIQGLLMEGVQRIDEMGLYRERIPHNRFYPAAVPNAPQPKNKHDLPDATVLALLKLCDGTRNLDDLARATGHGEFPTVKAVYNLLRTGQVQLRRGPTLDAKTAQRLVREFNDLIRDIFMVVATYGRMDATRRALSSWLANSPHAASLGTEVDIDGTLDAKRVILQMEKNASDDPMQALHQALHELAAYALFTASTGLPRQEEQALSRDINRRLKQLRL
jgi:hypothetical protein